MLTVNIDRVGDVVLARCAGRIVRGEPVCTLRKALTSERNTRVIVLDLSEVESVDAGGLSALVALHLWSQSQGVQLKLTDPSAFVRRLLAITGLDSLFEVSSFRDALLVLGCNHAKVHSAPLQASACH